MCRAKKVFLLPILTLISAVMLCACLCACGGDEVGEQTITPPGNDSRITAVTIHDSNDRAVTSGVLSVDLSYGSVTLTAEVDVTSGTAPSAVFESQNKDVATVTETGEVTLLKSGEAVLTASAGDKSHSIVLVVGDIAAGKYALVVDGGKAQVDGDENWTNAISVSRQSVIALQPEIPAGMQFVGWSFTSGLQPVNPEYLNRNGENIFEMPAMDITVEAEFELLQ